MYTDGAIIHPAGLGESVNKVALRYFGAFPVLRVADVEKRPGAKVLALLDCTWPRG